jgi:hypothetical protein
VYLKFSELFTGKGIDVGSLLEIFSTGQEEKQKEMNFIVDLNLVHKEST